MSLIDKDEILKVLRAYNPWWADGRVPSAFVKTLRRTSFYKTITLVDSPQLKRAIILAGPRRVGKTTILYQLANRVITEKGGDPYDVLYLTLEHPILKLAPIDQILELYTSEISPGPGEKYLLLDELQYIDTPTVWLKILVDSHPEWKIIVTGSASITFRQKDLESGVGRWTEVVVPTLSFFEYCLLRHHEKDDIAIPTFSSGLRPTSLGDLPEAERRRILKELKPLRDEFRKFLLQGGFPETALQEDLLLAQRLLREDIVDKVLKRDMAAFYGIRKLQELERLFVYLCLHTGSVISREVISRELGVSEPTFDTLMNCLEGAHLIRRLGQFNTGGKKVLKSKSKCYVVDSSMRNAVLLRDEALFDDPVEMGAVVEAATINQLLTYEYPNNPKIGYWKDRKNKEVDIVIADAKASNIAIECKYRTNIRLTTDEGIYRYEDENDLVRRIVVCKDGDDIERIPVVLKSGKRLSAAAIPAHVFLYLLGHVEHMRNQRR